MQAKEKDLIAAGQLRENRYNPRAQATNNAMLKLYVLPFDGDITKLIPQESEVAHFEIWSRASLLRLTHKEAQRFVPGLLEEEVPIITNQIQGLVSNE